MNVLEIAIRVFGSNAQIDVAVEEIADVEIMLEQLRIIFGTQEKEIDDVKTFKLKRLADRLKELIPDTEEGDT